MFQFGHVLGIIAADKDGIVKSVSCRNGDLKSNIIGDKWYNAFPILKEKNHKLDDKHPMSFRLPEIGRHILVNPSYGEKGDVSGLHILVEKIDEEGSSAQYLNKMLCFGKIVPGIAHEISNPLTYVSGLLQMFCSEADKDDPKKEAYEALVEEFERISKLVGCLFEFAKKSPTTKKIFNVNQVMCDVVIMVGYTLRNENIWLIKDLFPSELKIYGDNNKLKQVFLNLLQNSREAMPTGGKIYISTNLYNNDSVVIKFRDTGCGVAENQLENAFKPFYTTKINENGTGLGLSVCKSIIEEIGGTIDLSSKTSEGTDITIVLPISSSN